ncbi:hypothetical protein K439DRAFT_1347108, partial [Ramaria rubella]
PCIGQIKATVAQLEKKTDVVYISGMGSGKTLTFWMLLIYKKDSITSASPLLMIAPTPRQFNLTTFLTATCLCTASFLCLCCWGVKWESCTHPDSSSELSSAVYCSFRRSSGHISGKLFQVSCILM